MRRARQAGTALAVLLGSGVLLWASGAGEPLITSPSVTIPDPPDIIDAPEWGSDQPVPEVTRETSTEPGPEGLNLELVALALLGALVLWWLGWLLRHRRAREPDDLEAMEPDDELDILVQATTPATVALGAFDGEPRNAVVACWVALEDALARAGVAPQAGETSWDLTQRVLSRWQVDPEVLARLASLFREARFSRHPMTDQHAQDAAAALHRVHLSLVQAAAHRNESPLRGSERGTP